MGFCDSTEVCPPPLGFSDSYALLLWEPDITLIVTFSSPDVTSCVKEIKFTSPLYSCFVEDFSAQRQYHVCTVHENAIS